MIEPSPESRRNIEATLAAVCEAAVKLVGVNHSGLVLFDEDRKWGTVVAEYPVLPTPSVGKRIPVGGVSPEEELVNNGEPLVVNEVSLKTSLGPVRELLLGLGIKSIIVVPIVVDDEVRGSFSFDAMDEPRTFRDDEVEKCKSLARFASIVIKNAYLLHDLEALGEAVLAIASEEEPEKLLQVIMTRAVTLLRAQGGGIYEYNERRGELGIISVHNPPAEIEGQTLRLGEGMAGSLIQSGDEYLALREYDFSHGSPPGPEGGSTLRSVLGVPLVWKEKRIGVLWVHDGPGRRFKRGEVELLQRFAATASIAIDQSRLNESARSKAERLQNLATATNEIITRLSVADRDERLTLVAEHAHRITNAEACSILLVQKEGELTLVASHGHRAGGFQKGRKFSIRTGKGTGLTGHIAHMGEVFNECGAKLSEHPAVALKGVDSSPSGQCYSLLAIPMKKESGKGSELLGLLRISNKRGSDGEPHPWTCFTEDDQSIAEIFAQAATIAIETADLIDEIRRGKDRYKSLVGAYNAIVRAETPEQGLDKLAQLLLSVLRKSFCRILLIDESQKFLRVIAAAKRPCSKEEFKWSPRTGEKTPISFWKNLARALEKGKPGVLRYENERDRETLDWLGWWISVRNYKDDSLRVQAFLSIPLKIGERVVGLLTVGELRDREDEGFTEEQEALAVAISAQATVLIDKAWQEQQRDRRRQLYEGLEKAIQRIRDETSSDKILRALVHEAASVFSAEVAGMVLEQPGSKWLTLIDSTGAESPVPHRARLVDLGGVFREVIEAGESKIVYDHSVTQEGILSEAYEELKTVLFTPVSFAASQFVLFVGDTTGTSGLGKADRDVLERLCQQCSMSLSRALIREQHIRASEGAHAIAEAMALGDPSDRLPAVVKGIRQTVDCGAVTLYRFDPMRENFLLPPAMDGVWDPSAEYLREVAKNAPTWKILNLEELHVAEDAPRDETMKCDFVIREQIKSSAGTRIIVNQDGEKKSVGVMFVNYRVPHRFTDEDKKIIKLFAHQAAVVINNMMLYERVKEEQTKLEALYDIERAINSSADLQTIFDVIARKVFEVASANGRNINVADINLLEDDQVLLVAGYPEEQLAKIQAYVGAGFDLESGRGGRIGIVGWVIKNNEALIENDIAGNRNYMRAIAETESQLVVPIKNDAGEAIGAVSVESADRKAFTEHDKALMETLARQASVALTKSKQQRVSSNAKAIALVGAAGTIWGHRIKGLARLITSAATSAEGLLVGDRRDLEEAADYLRDIREKAQTISQAPSTAPLSAEHEVEDQLLNPLIERQVKKRGRDAPDPMDIEADLSASAGRSVKVSADWFGHALDLILDNATRAAELASEKRIRIETVMQDAARCLIKVSNTGPRIPDKIWDKLGNEPIAGTGSKEQLGIGILLADMILGVYGGKWQKLVNEQDGVTVGILMPVGSPEPAAE